MLKPKKKITKKEIKQDTLITAYANVTSFYDQNKKYISYALTALVAIIVGIFIYSNNRRANNEKAATELGKVFSIYDGAATNVQQFRAAIDGHPERGIMGLKSIVDNYGSTKSGEIARLYLANAYLNLGQFEEALRQYDSFGGSDRLMKASALAGMGSCYEAKGEYEKAASSFEKASGTITNNFNTPDYLNSAARCYGLAGEKERALAIFKRIKKEYPTSTYAREAERYLSQFSLS